MSSFIPNRQSSVFKPRIISSDSSSMRQEIASSVLPKGASLAVPSSFHQRTASGFFGGNMPMGVSPFGSGGGGGSSMYHMQRPYMPGVESPDRVQYPRTREEANRAWRLFHETDPIFGTAMDMYAEMLVSDFDVIVGDDKSSEIRNTLEYMCQTTNLMDRLRYIIREYLVLGEAIPHCWTPEQSVLTPTGFKRIDTVAEGDLVLTHEHHFRPVTEVHVRDYSGDVLNFDIEGISALPCRCTPEHPLYVWTEDGPVWKRAKDVTTLDHIAVGIDKDVEDVADFDVSDVVPEYFDLLAENDKHNEHTGREPIPDIVTVDEDFMRLVGYYYSEGNAFVTGRKGRLTFSFHIDETSYHEDVARIVKAKFGVDCRFDMKPDTHTCQVHVDSKIVASFFLNLFGTGCRDKLVQPWLRKLPIHKQKSFLVGLFRGDGNLYYNEQNSFTTAQVQLAHEGITHLAWQMLLRMDVAASFNIFNKARYGSYWKCVFNASMYPELAEEIFEKKVEFAPVVRKHAQIRHSSLFYRVRSIEREEYEGSVYNLEVEEDHSYVVGGIVSHNCFFDDSLGIWTYIAMHNPDFIEVLDSPIVNMDPIISFIPDESLRSMMSAGTPEAREFRSRLPADFVSRILARQKIRLSPLNCTFIPRKLHPYQTRGTSLASRMWRIFMVEDAVYNSTIATFRRHASPVKVLKLGDPATGWIPAPGAETKLLEMLNRAEVDPHCLVPETLITRDDGSQSPLGELKLGDRLLDKDGSVGEVEALQEETTDELVELDVVGSPLIRCTPSHKWPAWGGPRTCSCGCGTPILRGNFALHHGGNPHGHSYRAAVPGAPVKSQGGKIRFLEGFDPRQKLEAQDLRPGDYLMIPRKFSEFVPADVSLEKARLLGYYLAEGNGIDVYTREDGSVRKGVELSFNADEEHTLVKDSCEIVEHLCGYVPEIFKEANHIQVRVRRNASSDLADWLVAHGGSGAPTKKLSAEVMSWPLSLKHEIVKGYFGGDGGAYSGGLAVSDEHRYVEVSSSSLNLMNQVKLILAQIGTYASFSKRPQSAESFGAGNLIYKLSVYGDYAAKLAWEIWGIKASVCNRKNPKQWWMDDDHLYVKIRAVQKVKCEGPQKVINMTVSGDHSYLTDCIGTHNSWLIYHYGINFEQWGTTDKAITIGKEHDVIERVKLLALGLSKSFMTGEVTYASAKSGLQVFLRRLLSLRQLLENLWIYPKFFRPISEINDWTTASKSEVNHNYRVKRTAQEIQERNMVMVPTLKWKNKLDPTVDTDVLAAYQILEKFGIKLSKATVSSAVGVDWEDELEKSLKEFKTEKEKKETTLGQTELAAYEAEYGKGGQQQPGGAPPGAPGGPGAGAKPPAATGKPPGGMAAPGAPSGGMNDASNPPGSAEPTVPGALGGGIEAPAGGGLPG